MSSLVWHFINMETSRDDSSTDAWSIYRELSITIYIYICRSRGAFACVCLFDICSFFVGHDGASHVFYRHQCFHQWPRVVDRNKARMYIRSHLWFHPWETAACAISPRWLWSEYIGDARGENEFDSTGHYPHGVQIEKTDMSSSRVSQRKLISIQSHLCHHCRCHWQKGDKPRWPIFPLTQSIAVLGRERTTDITLAANGKHETHENHLITWMAWWVSHGVQHALRFMDKIRLKYFTVTCPVVFSIMISSQSGYYFLPIIFLALAIYIYICTLHNPLGHPHISRSWSMCVCMCVYGLNLFSWTWTETSPPCPVKA